MLTEEQIAKIREYCAGLPIEVVYLFGSQATDKANKLSDYDFGVLFDKNITSGQRFEIVIDMMDFLGQVTGFGDRVDVVDLNRAYLRFRFEVTAQRGDIYSRSSEVRDEFEQKTMDEYYDYLYFLKRNSRMTMNRIATFGFS
jgi:predicted nucleotidyltransferase